MTIGPETLAALALVIAAIGTAIVNIMTARTVRKKVEENNVLTTETLVEAREIKHHVNSAASASAAQIEALTKEVAMLKEMAAEKKEIASNLAIQTKLDSKPSMESVGIKTIVNKQEKLLTDIEKNTDETVKELKKEK